MSLQQEAKRAKELARAIQNLGTTSPKSSMPYIPQDIRVPVKGIDYDTAAEKQILKAEILAELRGVETFG